MNSKGDRRKGKDYSAPHEHLAWRSKAKSFRRHNCVAGGERPQALGLRAGRSRRMLRVNARGGADEETRPGEEAYHKLGRDGLEQ